MCICMYVCVYVCVCVCVCVCMCVGLWNLGYAAIDIITTTFRVCKNVNMNDKLKLAFIKVYICVIYMELLLFSIYVI